jgi:hypothetical protein
MIQILYVKPHVPLALQLDALLDIHAMPQEMLAKLLLYHVQLVNGQQLVILLIVWSLYVMLQVMVV